MNAEMYLPLDYLRAGEQAEVVDVTGDAATVGRMAELGIRLGCRLQVLQPGSPCLIELTGSRLCLRGDTCSRILVKPIR